MTGESLVPPLQAIKIIVSIALEEDAAQHDRTSALLPEKSVVDAVIVTRQRMVVALIDALDSAFGAGVRVDKLVTDGDVVNAGSELAALHGSARAILSAERTALNILARFSGIATLTRRYVDRLAPSSQTRILDTRKTAPGLRALEKYAVRCGGGYNHRLNLAETIFIKDNHIAAAGGLDELLEGRALTDRLAGDKRAGDKPVRNRRAGKDEPLIIEADTLDGVRAALAWHPTRILLDNMSDSDVAKAIGVVNGECELEASGKITLERVTSLSKLGVDYISVGALTHSAPAVDLSLEIVR